jgi:hypothetical protein
MNDAKMDWLAYAKGASGNEGEVFASDSRGQTFILEWKKTGILSPELASFKKALCDFAVNELAESEFTLLKAYPEAASSEIFLRACKPLLDKDAANADWQVVKEIIKTSVKQFYEIDISKFGPDLIKPLMDDIYFCATARKAEQQDPLGFLLFSITPALPFGDVKVINFFVKNEQSETELRLILMGLILKVLPQTQRIFLFARPTDTEALNSYAAMGFQRDENPFKDPSHKINPQYLTSLEYKIGYSNALRIQDPEMH